MAIDEYFMGKALKLAKKGVGWTNPHPMVGAVIVKGGKMISLGYHRRFGGDHAEMEAIKQAKENVEGSTMYVTLEPCHLPYDLHGPRIPCTEVIKQAGISRVHMAMLDSNPEVSGRGRRVLETTGITTTLGLRQKQVLILNETYHHFMTKKRPFVAITFSASWDGKIATYQGDSQWITNEAARLWARRLRGQYQAILVGINTVIADDPHLGVRLKGKKDPIRIILDSSLRIPLQAKVLRDTNVILATTKKAAKNKLGSLRKLGITVLTFNQEQVPVKELLTELKKKNIVSVLVEGGGKTLGSFVDARMIDKVYAFHAPILVGGRKAISAIEGEGVKTINEAMQLRQVSYKKLGNNWLTIGYV